MTPEIVEDMRAARYRAVHHLRDAVASMALEVERDRDANLDLLMIWVDGSREVLHQAEDSYSRARYELEMRNASEEAC